MVGRSSLALCALLAACRDAPESAHDDAKGDTDVAAETDLVPADTDPSADTGAPPVAPEGICSRDGWCWVNPLPQGNDLLSIHGSAPDNVWMVDAAGVVLRFDGQRWQAMTAPTYAAPADRVSDRPDWARWDVWNVSAGRYAPETWARRWARTLWVGGPDDVWLQVDGIQHYDGTAWTDLTQGERLAGPVAGSAADDVWLASTGGLLHWDGGVLAEVALPEHEAWAECNGLFAAGHRDVHLTCFWIGGPWGGLSPRAYGTLLHRAQGTWAPAVPAAGALGPFWKLDQGSRWAATSWIELEGGDSDWTDESALATWIGGWQVLDAPFPAVRDLWGADDALLVVGSGGAYWQTGPNAGVRREGPDLLSAWGSAADDVWAVGLGGAIQRWDGQAWRTDPPALTTDNLVAAWGSAPDDVWAVGDHGTATHWDGQRWSAVRTGVEADLASVWGASHDDVWAVGTEGTLLHYDGVAWQATDSGTTWDLAAVSGSSADDVWVSVSGDSRVEEPFLLRRGANGWRRQASEYFPGESTLAVAGPDDVWINSDHWNGATWTSFPDNADSLHRGHSVRMVGAEVWRLAGDGVTRWNGQDFDTVVFTADSKTSSRNELTAMAGTPGDVWAVGLNGVAAHWDGVNATTEETGVIAVRAVWVTATDVWAFGDRGAIVRRAR